MYVDSWAWLFICGFLAIIVFYLVGRKFKNLACKKHGTRYPCVICDEELKRGRK